MTRRFNTKTDRRVDKANNKIFLFIFARFSLIAVCKLFDQRFYMYGSLFYS